MRPLYLALILPTTSFFLTLGLGTTATAQDTGYFSYNNQPIAPRLASYYEIKVHTDSGWIFQDRWMNNRLKVTGRVSDDMKQRLGTLTYYDTAGVVAMRRKYVGYGGAIETHYYPDGQVMLQGPTLEDHKSGEWTGYYPSGKIRATASYTNDELDTASFFNEDGSPDNSMDIFYQEADYPGGGKSWLQFLNKNLRYPDAAAINGIEGTVVVGFKVSKDGRTSDFSILQSAGKYLDDEAVRVMRESGDWLPAVYGGNLVDTYKSQAVVFKSENLSNSRVYEEEYDKTFTKVEIEAAFPGGAEAWLRYVSRYLQYPREARYDGVQGTVIVQFIVDQLGNISYVQAIAGPETGGLREEAVRLIKKSGRWTPAIQNGRQVKSYKKQPVVFNLDR